MLVGFCISFNVTSGAAYLGDWFHGPGGTLLLLLLQPLGSVTSTFSCWSLLCEG